MMMEMTRMKEEFFKMQRMRQEEQIEAIKHAERITQLKEKSNKELMKVQKRLEERRTKAAMKTEMEESKIKE